MQIYVQNIRFFDEVSPKLEEQLAAMQTLGMRYLCPRNVNGKILRNILCSHFGRM